MVWLLTSTGSDCLRYLLTSFPYTVGRQDCTLLLSKDQSVSRRHAYLTLNTTDRTLLLVDAGSKYGTLLNAQRIVENQGVEVKHGDVVKFGNMVSEFRIMFLEFTVFASPESINKDVKFCKRTDDLGEAMYILFNERFEVNVEIARAISTGKPVINNRYLDDCLRTGQLLDDSTYRIIFPKMNLTLQYNPSFTFLSFFGIKFEQEANLVIGQSASSAWISEECLLRACLLGTGIQVNEPLIQTIAPNSDQEDDNTLSEVSDKYTPVRNTIPEIPQPTGILSKGFTSGNNVASHTLMTHQLVSLCRPLQKINDDIPSDYSKNTKRFVKNLPMVRRRKRRLPTIISMETRIKTNGGTFEETATVPKTNAKEAWSTEERQSSGKRRTPVTPDPSKKSKTIEACNTNRPVAEQQSNVSITNHKVEASTAENQFKSTFFKSLKK